jgi:hypothetical protein
MARSMRIPNNLVAMVTNGIPTWQPVESLGIHAEYARFSQMFNEL